MPLFDTKLFNRNIEVFVRSLYQKRYRVEHGMCICEGLRACKELYNLRPDLIEYGIVINDFDTSVFEGINFYTVEKHRFEKLSSTITTQGILLISKIPKMSSLEQIESPFVLILDRLSDPGNVGTILRTCAAVGLKDIWCSINSVDPYSEKTIRSALSAQFALNLYQYEDIDALMIKFKSYGFDKIFRTEPAGGISCFNEPKLFDRSIIVFGNEANGIKKVASAASINIPMPGKFESLNVAQAAAVILFEAVRRGVLR